MHIPRASRIRCSPVSPLLQPEHGYRNSQTSVPAERTDDIPPADLLIREHEEQTLLHLPVTQYPVKFLFASYDPFPILTIDDENRPWVPGVIVSPQ